MLMMALLSAVGTSLMVVAQTETASTMNYTSMSQARYAAESGVHRAAHYLLFTYAAPAVADLASYNLTGSPVEFNNNPVVLSSDPDVSSNYPVSGTVSAFAAASAGSIQMGAGSMGYTARATLLAMRSMIDAYGSPQVLQTWEITGIGSIAGIASSDIEVSAIIERQVQPAFNYAAFATANGCAALSFAGGATTDSYDSRDPLVGGVPVYSNTGGNVGSNGNLSEVGNGTTIGGSLSTPRAGVGNCTSNNVTAATISGQASVEEGLVQLPQPITFPTPAAPSPMPPTSNTSLNAAQCAALTGTGQATCTRSGSNITIIPAPGQTVVLGNVTLNAGDQLTLGPGFYTFNSLDMTSNGTSLSLDGSSGGDVIINIAGQSVTRPIDMTGGSIVNNTFDPGRLQFVYAGTGELRMRGGAAAAAVVYAPNAEASLAGGADFFGSIVTGRLTATGGSSIHYDRALAETGPMTAGNFTMNTFTWSTF
jgi:hypothetical protein